MAVLRMLAQKGMFWITDTFTRNSCLNAKLLLAALAICFIGRTIYLLYFAPLSKLPGSALAKLTMLPIKLDALLGRLGDACERDYYKYGDIYVVGPNAVVLNNPVDCRTVLGTHRFIKSSMYKEFALIDDTMFTTQSAELTHVRRRQVGPAFTYGYLNEMEPTILDCGIHAIKRKWDGMLLQKGEATVEYSLHFSLTTFDIIGALGYGQRFNALEQDSSQIVDWVNNYNRLAVLGIVFPYLRRFPFSLMVRGLLKSKTDFVEFGNNAAESRREMLRAGKAEKPKDLLQALIDGEDPESRVRMTGSQITAENIGFLIGGTDTTSLTMSWTLHYLLLYPNAYRKAVSEVRGKFARDHTITYAQGKAHLPYVDACIHEAMRIRAVSGVFLPRIVPRGGATFQGHYLPEGTQVGVNIAGANHHQGTWDNPQRFAPERFIVDERAKQNVITFSSGVRICPGRNLAMYEMMTILANLLKDYDFELPSDAIFRPERLDGLGNPVVMPRKHSLTVVPKYPERDCRVIIRHAVW
ncbi:cytochrome P450 [Coemansia spiralis]|nr:cytochrome P450 [Coemansia spiralis]